MCLIYIHVWRQIVHYIEFLGAVVGTDKIFFPLSGKNETKNFIAYATHKPKRASRIFFFHVQLIAWEYG